MKNLLGKERLLFFVKTFLIMKILLIFIFFAFVQAAPMVTAQNINLNFRNSSLEKVLSELSRQAKVDLVYDSNSLKNSKAINVNLKGTSLNQALHEVFKDQPFEYELKQNTLVVRASPVINLKNNGKIQQDFIKVTGLVTDTSGVAIAGASIVSKSTPTLGTATDRNGRFILEVPLNTVLVVSYIGFLAQDTRIVDNRECVIRLYPDAAGLDEVVVVGFGQQKKESVVSSIATVKGEELRMPTRSLSNNLAGQVPGLIAVQRSGEPGYDNAEFWIRGTSSFAGGTSPLVLVDGVPRNMNDIEPDEIETFTLLKDASATAIYGAEGANGVVLITSKRGRVQKTNISYRGEYSLLSPTRLPSFLGAADYLSLYDEALVNEGKLPIYQDLIPYYQAGQDRDLYPDVSWMDLLRKTTNNTRHTLNFRGGGEKARFFVSGAYFNESGLFKNNPVADYENNIGLRRYNLRSNVDLDITKTTLLRVDLSGQYLETNYPGTGTGDIFQRMTIAPPYLFPMVYSDGTNAGHPRFSGNRTNPYNLLMESGYAKEWRNFIQSRIDLEQKLDILTQGLFVKGSVSYDGNSTYLMRRTKTPEQFHSVGRDVNGELIYNKLINETKIGEPSESNNGNKRIYIESAINYSRKFADKHDVSGMLLYYQKSQQNHDQALAYKKQAYVGRGTYFYDNRYSIEANFGFTGSETFASGNRFGFFPAVGLAWILTNEPFFPESLKKDINSVKFRVSIGRTGNDNTGGERFLYRPTYAGGTGFPYGIGGSGALNNLGGLVEGRFAAPELAWEIEDKRNYGIDLSLFNGRVDLQADYFDNLRTNILLQRRTVSEAAGFRQSPWQNYGKVSNKGVDMSLNLRQSLSDDLRVSVRGNLTYAKNKILEYDEVPQLYPWMNITGTSLNTHNLYIAEGLYTKNDFDIKMGSGGKELYTLKEGLPVSSLGSNLMPGDIKYKDLNGDGIINQFDQTRYEGKPAVPELIYGLGLNIDYKGFYTNVFFQGAGNTSVVLAGDNPQGFFPFQWGIDESSARSEVANRWTENNPSQDVLFPRIRTNSFPHNSAASTWWLRDASFLRLKNIEVGYQFNNLTLNRFGFTAFRIYAMGQNVAVWDKIKMWDPEIGNANAGMAYPLPSIWTLGLELTL